MDRVIGGVLTVRPSGKPVTVKRLTGIAGCHLTHTHKLKTGAKSCVITCVCVSCEYKTKRIGKQIKLEGYIS